DVNIPKEKPGAWDGDDWWNNHFAPSGVENENRNLVDIVTSIPENVDIMSIYEHNMDIILGLKHGFNIKEVSTWLYDSFLDDRHISKDVGVWNRYIHEAAYSINVIKFVKCPIEFESFQSKVLVLY